jgi:hypothetical protein
VAVLRYGAHYRTASAVEGGERKILGRIDPRNTKSPAHGERAGLDVLLEEGRDEGDSSRSQ